MRTGFAIAAVYLALILIPVDHRLAADPPDRRAGQLLIQNLPQYAADLSDFVEGNERLRQLEEDYNITAELERRRRSFPPAPASRDHPLRHRARLVNSIFAGVTILVSACSWSPAAAAGWTSWPSAGAQESGEWLRTLFDRIARAVGNYVAGALGQALIAGVLAWMVLLILGVPYAGSLAVVIFMLDLVPLVGATLGAILVGIITLFNDFPTDTIVWMIWSIVYQQWRTTSSSRASRPARCRCIPSWCYPRCSSARRSSG